MTLPEAVFCFSIVSFIFVILICGYYERWTKIAPVPTLPWVKKEIIKALQTHLDPKTPYKMVELGSGWGGLSFAMARAFPQAEVTGYELSPCPYWFSQLRTLFSRKKICFEQCDLFSRDLSGFDVVVYYLAPVHMPALKEKFETELPGTALIIANGFALPEWEPVEIRTVNILIKIPIYVYRLKK